MKIFVLYVVIWILIVYGFISVFVTEVDDKHPYVVYKRCGIYQMKDEIIKQFSQGLYIRLASFIRHAFLARGRNFIFFLPTFA
jgi:hypothetical protein